MNDKVTPIRPNGDSPRVQFDYTEQKLMKAYAIVDAAHNAISQSSLADGGEDILNANIAIGHALEMLEEVREECSGIAKHLPR